MSDDNIDAYEPSTTHFAEPFGDYGTVLMQSGIPVRVKDSGGQGSWLRVPQPLAGEEGEVLTVQPDLSAAWEPASTGMLSHSVSVSNATLRTVNATTIVPAAGPNTVVVPTFFNFILRYGGTNAWVSGPTMLIRYNNVNPPQMAGISPNWALTFSQLLTQPATLIAPGALGSSLATRTNQPLTMSLNSNLTGNAANDNTLDVITYYYVLNV